MIAIASKYAKERTAFGKSIAEFGLIKSKLGEMTIRTYALESMIYRTAGMIEAAVSVPEAGADKVKQAMQVLEEYAVESSASVARLRAAKRWTTAPTRPCRFFGGVRLS